LVFASGVDLVLEAVEAVEAAECGAVGALAIVRAGYSP